MNVLSQKIQSNYVVVGLWFLLLLSQSLFLSGCTSTDETPEPITLDDASDVAVVYTERRPESVSNPIDGTVFAPGGDLYLISINSPERTRKNLTLEATQGLGDVADPDVSFDGQKVVFSMRRPQDVSWNIWEYLIQTDELRAILIDDTADDLEPAYLPDGRIVFTSNRQARTQAVQLAEGKVPYRFVDEYERETVLNLHVMSANGSNIEQISFNQSHDRNPSILSNGKILFSRWEHVGGVNRMALFTIDPDGSDLFVLYGSHSPGEAYYNAHEAEDGSIVSLLMPLSDTFEGGALIRIDSNRFSEFEQPDNSFAAELDENSRGHRQIIANPSIERGISLDGRYATPFPLWDGTSRILAAWTPNNTELIINPETGDEEERLGDPNYGLYLIDTLTGTSRPIITSNQIPGQDLVDIESAIITGAVALIEREVPIIKPPLFSAPELSTTDSLPTGLLNVFSVYDTDELERMGAAVLASSETIPTQVASEGDSRASIANLNLLKDPMQTSAAERPARFFRVTRAIETPANFSSNAIGDTSWEMQQILGYGVVEPDGSLQVDVPADVAIAISVLDEKGRAFYPHTSWLQVRAGETRSCNGCHSPRRGNAINDASVRASHPNVVAERAVLPPGETMAQTASRVVSNYRELQADMIFVDGWTDPAQRAPDPDIRITYDELTTPVPENGIINYIEHIQPLWGKERGEGGENTCTACHNNSDVNSLGENGSQGLDLRNTDDPSGFVTSYVSLLQKLGTSVEATDGDLARKYVQPGFSRVSFLVEKLDEEELLAPRNLLDAATRLKDHNLLLNASEKRLLYEWIDLGAQYSNGGTSAIQKQINSAILPDNLHQQLLSQCGECHRPHSDAERDKQRRFVLTGKTSGDLNNILAFVDTVNPELSTLIYYPSYEGFESVQPLHPQPEGVLYEHYLMPDSSLYHQLLTWIQGLAQ
ncbi:MAG: hypothetical protein AAGB12_01800 [Pseudomonadota bacterium]